MTNFVISYNTHTSFCYGSFNANACFFCGNGFSAPSEDSCVPILPIRKIDPVECGMSSFRFTKQENMTMNIPLMFYALLIPGSA